MPIDFLAITNSFQVPIRREMNPIVDAFKRLGDWLAARTQQASNLEMASRDFPIVQVYNEGITVWIDSSQHGSLGPEPPPRSVWDSLVAAGRAFVEGFGAIGRSVDESLILPRLAGVVADAAEAILASLERFSEPTPSMFSRGTRSASDLFGEVGLFFRAFGTSLGQIEMFVAGARAFPEPPALATSPAGPLPVPGASPVRAARPTPGIAEPLDDIGRYLTGAILALPLLPDLLGTILSSAGLSVRAALLDRFQGVEASVFGLRREIIERLYVGLLDQVREAISLVIVIHVVLMDNLRYYLHFGLTLGQAFLASFIHYISELSAYFRYWTDLVESVRQALEDFLNFDIMPLIVSGLGLPGWVLSALPLPRVTIGDLFDVAVGGAITAARSVLDTFICRAEDLVRAAGSVTEWTPLVPTWDPTPVLQRLDALRRVVNIMVRIPRPLPPETRLPSLAGLSFPNVFQAFFGPGAPDIRAAIRELGDTMIDEVGDILGTGIGFLNDVSDTFERAAGRASRLGSPERYRSIADQAGLLAEGIFGPQTAELTRGPQGRPLGEVAGAFESWVAHGFLEVIGQAIPIYVDEMRQYWMEQKGGATPTSPHVLRRRRQLGRVQVPRLLIRAPGRALDAALVEEVTTRFGGAVEEAFRSGLAQYEAGAAR